MIALMALSSSTTTCHVFEIRFITLLYHTAFRSLRPTKPPQSGIFQFHNGNQGKLPACPYKAVISDCWLGHIGFIGYAPIGYGPRVAAIVRVRVGRGVVRVQVHVAVVPVRTKADSTNNVRVDEVGVDGAVKIPYMVLLLGGKPPLLLRRFTPVIGGSKGRRHRTRTRRTGRRARSRSRRRGARTNQSGQHEQRTR